MKKRTLCRTGDIIEVEWYDSSYNSGTFERIEAEQHKPIHIFTVGMVVKDVKDHITLATDHYDVERTFRYLHTIPSINILHVWRTGHGHCG